MISASLIKELREMSGAGMLDCKSALEKTNGNIEEAMDWLREKGFATATKKSSRIAAEGLAKIFIKDNKAVVVEVNAETDFVSKNEEFVEMIDTIGGVILDSKASSVEDALELSNEECTIKDLIVAKTAKIGEKLSLRRISVLEKDTDQHIGEYIHNGGKIAALTLVEGGNEEVAKDVAMQSAAMKPQYVLIEDVPEEVVAREREVLKEQSMNEGKSEEIATKMVEGRIKKFFKEIVLVEQAFIKDGDIDVKTYLNNNNAKLLQMIRFEVGEGMEKRSDDFASEVMSQIKGE